MLQQSEITTHNALETNCTQETFVSGGTPWKRLKIVLYSRLISWAFDLPLPSSPPLPMATAGSTGCKFDCDTVRLHSVFVPLLCSSWTGTWRNTPFQLYVELWLLSNCLQFKLRTLSCPIVKIAGKVETCQRNPTTICIYGCLAGRQPNIKQCCEGGRLPTQPNDYVYLWLPGGMPSMAASSPGLMGLLRLC